MEVNERFANLIKSVEAHDTAQKQTSVISWELENFACSHSKNITSQTTSSPQLQKCLDCELSSNLWLCLICGNVGCGRKYFDGTGGNNHGIDHFEKTGHQVSVKIGTLSQENNPSAYCYLCNDDVKVYQLERVLMGFGIDLSKMQKTEKTINEMSLDLNLNFKLSNKFEKDEKLEHFPEEISPYGIVNIGNSCYINSVIQLLASLDSI